MSMGSILFKEFSLRCYEEALFLSVQKVVISDVKKFETRTLKYFNEP